MKTLLAAGMILGSLVAFSGSALADPTTLFRGYDDALLLEGGPEDPCNGLHDTNCTCKYGTRYCSNGEKCTRFVAGTCVEG